MTKPKTVGAARHKQTTPTEERVRKRLYASLSSGRLSFIQTPFGMKIYKEVKKWQKWN